MWHAAHGKGVPHRLMAGYYGNWAFQGGSIRNQYLAVKFVIDGKIHYGWARMNVLAEPAGIDAVLTAYAYETKPNTRLLTGPPSGRNETSEDSGTLGGLALGAASRR
jgi:hypothetical protein